MRRQEMTLCRRFHEAFVVACLVAAAAGCGDGGSARPLPGPVTTRTLSIKGSTLTVEVALDRQARNTGLMFRESLAEESGMLFVYRNPQKASFWMRNTTIPLSIAFLSDEGEILQIEDMKPHDERGTQSKMSVRFALEVNQGWFSRNGIAVGDRFEEFAKSVADLDVKE